MTTPGLTFPEHFDNTTISGYRNCPKSAYWRTHRLIVPADRSVHLIAGGAFAKGLEVTRKRYFDDGLKFDEALAHGCAAAIAAYGTYNPLPQHGNKSLDNILSALGYYFEVWEIDRTIIPVKQPNGKHSIEFSFAVPIPGVTHPETGHPLLYTGRFDMFGKHETLKLTLGEDDKTTSQLGKTWMEQWGMANQISGYSWAAAEYGIPLAGFCLRGISLLKSGHGNAEVITYRPTWRLNEFLMDLIDTIRSMIADWRRGYWVRNSAVTCNAYGGCGYRLLCESPNPEDWVDQYYEPNTFNPLKQTD